MLSDNTNIEVSNKKLKKILFIYNAIEEGWKVEKKNGSYIFKKKHENREEIFTDTYLEQFIIKHLSLTKNE